MTRLAAGVLNRMFYHGTDHDDLLLAMPLGVRFRQLFNSSNDRRADRRSLA